MTNNVRLPLFEKPGVQDRDHEISGLVMLKSVTLVGGITKDQHLSILSDGGSEISE